MKHTATSAESVCLVVALAKAGGTLCHRERGSLENRASQCKVRKMCEDSINHLLHTSRLY